jgi:hypothetical protein
MGQLLSEVLESLNRHGGLPRPPPRAAAPLPPPPPPSLPVSIEQLLATQNVLIRMLVESHAHHGARRPLHHRQEMDSSCSDFLATHPPVFTELTDPLEAGNWLHTIESKFGLLHFTEYQKTLYVAQ